MAKKLKKIRVNFLSSNPSEGGYLNNIIWEPLSYKLKGIETWKWKDGLSMISI